LKAEVKARLARLSLSPARELEIIEELAASRDEHEQALSRGVSKTKRSAGSRI
jgi:hypothetical protein